MAGVRTALMRGGTSKGALFLADDLPADRAERDDLLLRIMGSPDRRQIDGVGGAHPLTSKVGVISPSGETGVDVDYLFLQVVVDQPVVTDAQTCGNILAAVGPFAIERGLVPAHDGVTDVAVRMVNTGGLATLRVQTPGGEVTYDGDTELSGVPGTAAPVEILVAPSDKPLLPTGNLVDDIAGVEATLIDNGMPSVIVRAGDLGATGTEDPRDLEADEKLTARVREIRAAASPLLGIDPDPDATTVPKIVLVSPPTEGGTISTRSFIPVRVHQAVGVLGAATVAAAAALPGTVAASVIEEGALAPVSKPQTERAGGFETAASATSSTTESGLVRVEHPTGFLDLHVETQDGRVVRTAVVRTARMLLDGTVYPGPARTDQES
ncbi:PrpF domain-containing protein [Nocardioides cheoyonin]|uniref:PrpF domain-containing protein n=1 Tax=Nocardioides cheoyonin TaxID=3156615 RepID=UPI0032B4484E